MYKVNKLAAFSNGIINCCFVFICSKKTNGDVKASLSINEDYDNRVAILDGNNGIKLVKTFWIGS